MNSRTLGEVEQMAEASLPNVDVREYKNRVIVDYENPHVEYDKENYTREQMNPFASGSLLVNETDSVIKAEVVVPTETEITGKKSGVQRVIESIDIKEGSKSHLYDLSKDMLELSGSCVIEGYHEHPDSTHVHVRCTPTSSRRLRDTALNIVDIIEEETS